LTLRLPDAKPFEDRIIGTILHDFRKEQIMATLRPLVQSFMFGQADCARWYKAAVELHEAGHAKAISVETIALEATRDREEGAAQHDMRRLNTLATDWYAPFRELEYLAEEVVNAYRRREAVLRFAQAQADLCDGMSEAEATSRAFANVKDSFAVSQWRFHDLEPYFDGTIDVAVQPGVLGTRDDHVRLVSPGTVGLLLAAPESGKSFWAMTLALEAAKLGRHTLYIDMESTPQNFMRRLLQNREGRLTRGYIHYVNPNSRKTEEDRFYMRSQMEEHDPILVVLDGYNAGLSAEGLKINENESIAEYRRRVVSPFLTDDTCVVMIDHVTKEDERRGTVTDPMGAGAKKQLCDWAIGFIPTEKPIGIGKVGATELLVAKDRHGLMRAASKHSKQPNDSWADSLGYFEVDSDDEGNWTSQILSHRGTVRIDEGDGMRAW
jgi:AAA domain